jgi:hypothetical protein
MQDTQIQMPEYQVPRALILRYKVLDTQVHGLDSHLQGAGYPGTGAWMLRNKGLDTQVQELGESGTGFLILRYKGLDSQVQGPEFLVTVAWIRLDTQV